MEVGDSTAKLDHFFMAAPYMAFLSCFDGQPVTNWPHFLPTLKVIHEMGSSRGISVLLMRSIVRASSSKAKVKMAPGGVQVPTMR